MNCCSSVRHLPLIHKKLNENERLFASDGVLSRTVQGNKTAPKVPERRTESPNFSPNFRDPFSAFGEHVDDTNASRLVIGGSVTVASTEVEARLEALLNIIADGHPMTVR